MRRLALIVSAAMLFLPAIAPAQDRNAVERQFQQWISGDLAGEARRAGISEASLKTAFSGVKLNWDLPDLVPPGSRPPSRQRQTQAEFSAPAAYFAEQRLQGLAATGRGLAATHSAVLSRIEQRFGVPAGIIVAVWGRESGFGRAKLPHSAVEVLATKAFMSTRKDMFRRELLAALTMIERGHVDPRAMKGSWAGALGQPQFMPTSYLKYAVDFDGDGHADIWNSVADSLASIANYLAGEGWSRHRDWGYEVSIPKSVSCGLEGPDRSRPIAEWTRSGITRISGRPFPAAELRYEGIMLLPAGRHGPQFIVTPNFYVLKQYNNSDLYALFIGNLADRIASNGQRFRTPWGDVGKMLRSDILKLQERLVAAGYDVGNVDGLPGFKTRRSLGEWQAKNGLSQTCFPDPSLL